jgi:predicted small metal-binding protein
MDCDFNARGATEDEVLKQAVAHASTAHQIKEMTPELAAKVRAAIRSV